MKLLEWTALGAVLALVLFVTIRPGGWETAVIMAALGGGAGLLLGLVRR
jgi:hypothetical protein